MHAIEYVTVKRNCDKAKVEAEIDHRVSMENWEEGGGLYKGIRWLEGTVYPNVEEAERALEELDRGSYDNLAVLFRDVRGAKETAKMKKIAEQKESTMRARDSYAESQSVHNRKSDTITCPKCKSRLALAYLRGEHCPLCNTELRSNTFVLRMEKYDDKLKELDKKYKEEKRKAEKKIEKKAEIKWRIKYEYHC